MLGAAVGTAVLGRKAGLRAAVVGAACNTLPDLDVFIAHGDPVRDFTFHRAETRALFWLTLAAPVIAWLVARISRGGGASYREWLLLVWLSLITHPLLDAFTVYGTQLLLPFSDYPVGVGSVFIIDPLVTAPMIAGLLAWLRWRQQRPGRGMAWIRARTRREHALPGLDGRGAVTRRRRSAAVDRSDATRRQARAGHPCPVQQPAVARGCHG